MKKLTNAIILLTVLLLAVACKEKPIYSENENYSQELEDRIERVIKNLQVETLETSHTNKYEKSTLENRLSFYFNLHIHVDKKNLTTRFRIPEQEQILVCSCSNIQG